MKSFIWVFVTVPYVVAALAVLFAQQVISPGSEWAVVVATISLYATTFGAIQAYEGQKVSQKMQDEDEARDKRRKDALVQHEIPHIVHLLKMLVLGMDRTALVLDKHSKNGKIQTAEAAEYLYRRSLMHIDAIRTIEALFHDAELSKYHSHLDDVLVNLDEIALAPLDESINISKFKESTDMVFHVMELISREYGVEYQRA